MTAPIYAYYHRDATNRDEPKKFCAALIATGRVWRCEKGLLNFKVAEGDYIKIERAFHLQQIIQDGETLRVAGDVDAECFSTLWLWATSRKHQFPRLNPERPYAPTNPAEEHRKTYQATLRLVRK